MRKLLILLLAFLAIAAIAYFCIYKTHVPAIQVDISSRAKSALLDNGISSVDVRVDGRDITLTGTATSAEIKQAAERIAQVEGYNFINNNIQVVDGQITSDSGSRGHSLAIILDKSGKVTLDGVLDANSHKVLAEATVQRYGKENTHDRILELDMPVVNGMPEVAILMMEKLSALSSGEARLINNNIDIKGISPSKVMLTQVKQQLKENTPEGYALNLDLDTAPAAKTVQKVKKVVVAKNATRSARKRCQRQFNRILRNNKIRFNSSSAILKKSSYRVLNKLAATAQRCKGMIIRVHGHTDSTGRNSLNRKLSKKRAKAVARYLMKKGVDKNSIQAVGHGSSRPVASNKTRKGRARNRRIELTVESIK